jgi:hypothetical protein
LSSYSILINSDFRLDDSSPPEVARFLVKVKEIIESDAAKDFSNDNFNLKLKLFNDEDTKTVTIDNLNADQIQSVKLRGPDVSLMFEGKGTAFVQVIRRYRNNDGSDEMKAFTDSCDGEEAKDDSGYVWYIGFAVLIAVLFGLAAVGTGFFLFKKTA